MSNVLELLRDARPEVPPPAERAQRAARERLLAVIEDEPPGLHARRARREGTAPPSAQRPGRASHPRPRPRFTGTRVPRRWRAAPARVGRMIVPALVAAIAIAVAVLALSDHRRAAAPGLQPSGHGAIRARGGESLAGVLPAVIVAGLRRQYGGELAGGRALRTTVDRALQLTGMRSLRRAIGVNHAADGAFVALDPRTGAVEAIGTAGRGGRPARVDSAVAAASAPGSAFTPITALAALQAGRWAPGETYDDTGAFCAPSTRACLHNAGNAAYGTVTLARALGVEDGVFIAQLGARLASSAPGGGALQSMARRMGLGSLTGIDLPGERAGRVPDRGRHPTRAWTALDTIVLALGEGDLAVTPVQLAVADAAIANGGTVVTPHLAAAGPAGGNQGWPTRRLRLSRTALTAVRQGLRDNAGTAGGVSSDVFGSLRAGVAGTVGSTQRIVRGRESTDGWYAGYVSDAGRPLVVVVRIRGGGPGDVTAAPVARRLFSQWLTGRPGRWTPGRSVAQ